MADGRQGNGGARPGAGRKPKAIKFATSIQQAENKIADKLPWVIDKLFELGEGVFVEGIGLTGPVVYQKPPDRDALKYLADRVMGKPTERQEVSGPEGEPLKGYVTFSPSEWDKASTDE